MFTRLTFGRSVTCLSRARASAPSFRDGSSGKNFGLVRGRRTVATSSSVFAGGSERPSDGGAGRKLNRVPTANEMPRPSGITSFMRLPVHSTCEGLDACFVGCPIDHGTSNRSGTRMGPRQMRSESVMIRHFNMATGADPYASLNVGDLGDVPANLYNLAQACDDITAFYEERVLAHGAAPLTLGGDHTIAYPILRAVRKKHGPVALIHVDAHLDTADSMMGQPVAHGTPFKRAQEFGGDGCMNPKLVYQIGIRGAEYDFKTLEWSRNQGYTVIEASECWHKSLTPFMERVRKEIGAEHPVYISFDIDAIDPGFAPGTGTPEIAGLTPIQALEIIRGCRGLNVVGCDLVEVSPPYDTSGNTALLGANLLFEMLCILPGVKYQRKDKTSYLGY